MKLLIDENLAPRLRDDLADLFPDSMHVSAAVRTGRPQNEIKHGQKGIFEELYEELPKLEQFMGAMTGLSRINFEAFASKFDLSRYQTLCDAGGATGLLSIEAAKQNAHLHCISFDLPAVEPIAQKHIAAAGLSDRIRTASGDVFKDPLPKADVTTMGANSRRGERSCQLAGDSFSRVRMKGKRGGEHFRAERHFSAKLCP